MTITAACFCAVSSVFCIAAYVSHPHLMAAWWQVATMLLLLGFVFGFIGGIFMLKRKKFSLALIGITMIKIGWIYLISKGGWIIGIPVILLTSLSMIFTVRSRKEFIS